MKSVFRIGALVAGLLIGAIAFLAQPAQAWTTHRHHRMMHHIVQKRQMSFHKASKPVTTFGTYPNVTYFTRNGHVYARNIDNDYTYLVK